MLKIKYYLDYEKHLFARWTRLKCKILWIDKKPDQVEKDINAWLSQHPNIKIDAVSQQPNFCYTIFYNE